MPVLVDSNVLLDVFHRDVVWYEWSAGKMAQLLDEEILCINPLIFAEISVAFRTMEELESVLLGSKLLRTQLPWEAAFLAGQCFLEYRRRGGDRRSPMPDFYIGAHALISGMALLTRDAGRYRTYFPRLRLITPG